MTLEEKLSSALLLDPDIIIDRSEYQEYTGSTERYLVSLGLTRSDLKKLERVGRAVRGYLPTAQGHNVRWLIFNKPKGDQL